MRVGLGLNMKYVILYFSFFFPVVCFGDIIAHMNYIDAVKEIKRRIFHAQEQENLEALIASDAQVKSPIKQGEGPEFLSEVMTYWVQSFPDVKSKWMSAEEIEPGKVVIKWQANGHHTGRDFLGVPTSGKPVAYSGITTYTFENQLLVRYEADIDLEAIKKQLDSSAA